MKKLFIAIFGVLFLVAGFYLFPTILDVLSSVNATSNITQYEGMPTAVAFAPLIIFTAMIGLLIWSWLKD